MTSEIIQILFTLLGSLFGIIIAPQIQDLMFPYPEYYSFLLIVLIFTSSGYLLGYFLSKKLRDLSRSIDEALSRIPGIDLVVGTIGLLTGLTVALIVSIPFFDSPYGKVYMLVSFFVFGFFGLLLSLVKSRELAIYIFGKKFQMEKCVVDTSALIDGRIVALLKNNLLTGKIVVPDVVKKELKRLADSDDPQRRKRGQRGLQILAGITHEYGEDVVGYEARETEKAVDDVLLKICLNEGAKLVTCDSNLSLLAKSLGIKVVNLNELQNDLKLPVEPGDEVVIKLVRKGRGRGQGVGYLEDGTMVVVEEAEDLVGKEVQATVKGLTYSSTGRVIFADLKREIRSS